ncbi:MAG: hypothetical protein HY854_16320 [Burkholderiales bacterium]|nr:hypothetical protein [Burkholderiales bacterium]
MRATKQPIAPGRRAFLQACVSLAVLPVARAWRSPAQTTVDGGVTIDVHALDVEADSDVWEFAVSMHAASGTVDDDLLESAMLSGDGQRWRPFAWEGDPPGLRHRVGVLMFNAPLLRPHTLYLLVTRREESHPRVYMWAFGRSEARDRDLDGHQPPPGRGQT